MQLAGLTKTIVVTIWFLFSEKFTGGNSGQKSRFVERKIGHGSQRIANIAEYFLGTANICCNLQIADVSGAFSKPFLSMDMA